MSPSADGLPLRSVRILFRDACVGDYAQLLWAFIRRMGGAGDEMLGGRWGAHVVSTTFHGQGLYVPQRSPAPLDFKRVSDVLTEGR